MTVNEYREQDGGIALQNFRDTVSWFAKWYMERAKQKKRFWLLADNRLVFRKLFGKPHFHFRGGHHFHCWDIVFNGGRFVVMTAKEYGTSYEQIGKCSMGTRIEFLEWLMKGLNRECDTL